MTPPATPVASSAPAAASGPAPIISAVPQLAPEPDEVMATAEVEPSPTIQAAAAPIISPVTRPSAEPAAPLAEELDKLAAASSPAAPSAVAPHLDMHAYRSKDLDLLTQADVVISETSIDDVHNDLAIADALLLVSQPNQVPEIKESLTRQ